MPRICQITGKKAMVGHKVSHSNIKTKRRFNVNLFKKKFYRVSNNSWVTLSVSAAGLRTINKLGLDVAIKKALSDGHVSATELSKVTVEAKTANA